MRSEQWLAAVLTLMSGAYLIAAFQIPTPEGQYAAVGPRAFPIAIGVGLLVCSIGLGVSRARSEGHRLTEWQPGLASAVVLVAYLLLFEPLGFPLATVAFITVEARLLGSRAPLRDLAVSTVVAVSATALFQLLLGIRLPTGPLG